MNSAKEKFSSYGHFVLTTTTYLYGRAGAQEGACQARSAEEAGPGRLGGAGAVPRESGGGGRGGGATGCCCVTGARDNLDTSANDLLAGTLAGAVLTAICVLARLVTLVTWEIVDTVTRAGDPGLVTASVSRDPMI